MHIVCSWHHSQLQLSSEKLEVNCDVTMLNAEEKSAIFSSLVDGKGVGQHYSSYLLSTLHYANLQFPLLC